MAKRRSGRLSRGPPSQSAVAWGRQPQTCASYARSLESQVTVAGLFAPVSLCPVSSSWKNPGDLGTIRLALFYLNELLSELLESGNVGQMNFTGHD